MTSNPLRPLDRAARDAFDRLPSPNHDSTEFDEVYAHVLEGMRGDDLLDADAATIVRLLGAYDCPGNRILDAPCGVGHHGVRLANAGFFVHGIDKSPSMLAAARRRRDVAGELVRRRLTFEQGDLCRMLVRTRHDAALCWFTSLGYSLDPDDDVRLLTTLGRAVCAPGVVLVETEHVASVHHNWMPNFEMEVGEALVQGIRTFDDDNVFRDDLRIHVGGRTFPHLLMMRVYTVDELVGLCRRAGLTVLDVLAHDGVGPVRDDTRALIVARAPEEPSP